MGKTALTSPPRLPTFKHRSTDNMGSVVLPHLITGWHVDQAIMSEEERLVIIRFGRDWDPDCMRQDEVLYRIADRVKNFAVIYVCDLSSPRLQADVRTLRSRYPHVLLSEQTYDVRFRH